MAVFTEHALLACRGQLCYYSDSGGQSWHVVGRSIDSVEGFELASGKFFAVDFHRPAYFFSGNGLSWTPIDFEEFNRTVSHPKFQKKVIVPQFHKDDIRKMNLRLGNWRGKLSFYHINCHSNYFVFSDF